MKSRLHCLRLAVLVLFSVCGSLSLQPAMASIKLNDPLVAGGNVLANNRISPDSSRVVYLADQDKAVDFIKRQHKAGKPCVSGVT